jgi:hypothetical protein
LYFDFRVFCVYKNRIEGKNLHLRIKFICSHPGGLFVKSVFRSLVTPILLILISGAFNFASAQIDSFIAQITVSATVESVPTDMSGNGRFVVFLSTGDLSTLKTSTRNNADGNLEVFLFDYAQRRIFQITNTKNRLVDTAGSTTAFGNIRVEVRNNRPMISNDGKWIVLTSNANSLNPAAASTNTSTPGNFDANALTGTDTTGDVQALLQDANLEVWLYKLPAFTDIPDLSTGVDPAFVDLSAGTFTRVTNTATSRFPVAGQDGTATEPQRAPIVAEDNRTP